MQRESFEGPRPLLEAGAEEGLPRHLCGRSPTEDRPSRLQERSARRRSRTTTTRLYAPPEAAGGRRDFMFTNFKKPGNDVSETRRQRKVKPHWNWRVDVSQSLLPWRDAPRRVFAAIGKGRERHGEGIYRSRDRWHARFRRPTFPTGGGKMNGGTGGPCVTTSR